MSTDDVFNEILRLSRELLERDPNLFKTAVARVQEMSPREPSPVRRAAGAEQKGVQSNGGRKNATAFHKYVLPGDKSAQEYYMCMTCGERRSTNSFHGDHQEKHKGEKFQVRWFCPMCNTYFAVTHRGYHIKNRHKADGQGKKRRSSGTRYDDVEEEEEGVEGEEDYEGSEGYNPDRKRRRDTDEEDATSQGSPSRTLVEFKRQPSVVLSDSIPAPVQIPVPVPVPVPGPDQPLVVQPPPPRPPMQMGPYPYQPGQLHQQPSLPRIQTSGDLMEPNVMPTSSPGPEPAPTGTFGRTQTDIALNGPQPETSTGVQQPEFGASGAFVPSATLADLSNTSGTFSGPQPSLLASQSSSLSGSQPGLSSLLLSNNGDGTGNSYFFPDNKATMEKSAPDNKNG